MPEARRGIGDYFAFFNDERPHQALGYCVPSAVYFSSLAESQREGRMRCTVDSQQFTVYRSPPAPPSTEQITAAEIVDCVHGFRCRRSSNQSRALAYEAPSVVQTMGSTPAIQRPHVRHAPEIVVIVGSRWIDRLVRES